MLRWKHKYWYWLVCGLFGPSITLAAMMVLKKQSIVTSIEGKESWITLAVSAPIFLSFFFRYIYCSFKENYPCRDIIKPSRMKYFYSGLSSSFMLFGGYLISWLIAWKVKTETAWQVGMGIVMIFGLVSLVYFSLYEFCISFDVFYNNNKKELVHDFLEKVSGKKLEVMPD